jgi:hypothetical protein
VGGQAPLLLRALFLQLAVRLGLLFGLGLYARYREDPDRFRAGYDDLLASTGMEGAADLGQRFGIDVGSADFWRASLDVCRERVADFERLAGAGGGTEGGAARGGAS